MIKLHNIDCMIAMKEAPDNYWDLAIVDPPYGLKKASVQGGGKLKNSAFNRGEIFKWDIAPSKEYFNELFRVSKNQIIWGANYFFDHLPTTRGIIFWDKLQPWKNFSAFELAWTSFNTVAKKFTFDNRTKDKIHPTQKPIKLYEWLLCTYAKKGDKILDTHLGSGTSSIAAHRMGFSFDGYEIDHEYYTNAKNRLEYEKRQLFLFAKNNI